MKSEKVELKEKEKEEEEEEDCVWKRFSIEELEKQYSPSKWSKEEEVIKVHVEEARRRCVEVRGEVRVREDVIYGKEEWTGGRADVYGEDLEGDAPVLVYVHGGYWQEMTKDISSYLVKPLYAAKVVVVVIGYDLAPKVGVADIVEEVREGVKWACQLASGRGSVGVILAGWSAGGQLVTQVLSEVERGQDIKVTPFDLIRGVVTLSGVFDLRPLVNTYVNDPLHLTPKSAWALSPLRSVEGLARAWCGRQFQMLMVVGEEESPEFKRQSEEYCNACKKAGLQADYVIISAVDHFSLVCDLFLTQYTLTSRLKNFIMTSCAAAGKEVKV